MLHSTTLLLTMLLAADPHPLAGVTPLPNAHAHNDYRHPRPLWDALEHGFTSIEADVFLVEGELLIGHDAWELTDERTLRGLYLDPLRELEERHGEVFPDGTGIVLLVDVKSDAAATYQALHAALTDYAPMLTRWEVDERHDGPVTVIVSGGRDVAAMRKQTLRYAACDGRLADLERGFDPGLMPLVSDAWLSHFTWIGLEPLPPHEHDKLRHIAIQIHAAGARLRFWGVPNHPRVWAALHEAGVDLINGDDLPRLAAFLRQERLEAE